MGDQREDDNREARREPKDEAKSGRYYYDDSTGYRIYKPDDEVDEDESENGDDEERDSG